MEISYLDKNFDPQQLTFDSVEDEKAFCERLASHFHFLGGESDKSVPWLLKEDISGEVVFYPGTFNPWHMGHRACLDLCPIQNIIVVPDFNPWKEGEERQRPWEHLKDLLYRLSETKYSIYPGFLAKEEGNPTVDWFPNVSIEKKSLLIGDDSFLSFHKWKDVEELVPHIATLYVAPRGGDSKEIESQIQRFPNLKVVLLDHHEFEDVSSTDLRRK